MTSAILLGLYGALISLVFEYVPPVATWYDGLSDAYKRTFMAVAMLVLALGAYFGQCQLSLFNANFDCSIGIVGVLGLWLGALTGNQIAHRTFKKPE